MEVPHMTAEPPRTLDQRKRDTLTRFERDTDTWVASADGDGGAYLVPLSFVWDGTAFTLATPEASPTGRNLRASGSVRLGFGPTRDVVLVDGAVEAFSRETVPAEVAEEFAAKLWDARESTPRYAYFRVTPRRIQAWREENELAGRDLMRDGRWLS
jgi:Pyridoxamine 5'-phosphate oxidase